MDMSICPIDSTDIDYFSVKKTHPQFAVPLAHSPVGLQFSPTEARQDLRSPRARASPASACRIKEASPCQAAEKRSFLVGLCTFFFWMASVLLFLLFTSKCWLVFLHDLKCLQVEYPLIALLMCGPTCTPQRSPRTILWLGEELGVFAWTIGGGGGPVYVCPYMCCD